MNALTDYLAKLALAYGEREISNRQAYQQAKREARLNAATAPAPTPAPTPTGLPHWLLPAGLALALTAFLIFRRKA